MISPQNFKKVENSGPFPLSHVLDCAVQVEKSNGEVLERKSMTGGAEEDTIDIDSYFRVQNGKLKLFASFDDPGMVSDVDFHVPITSVEAEEIRSKEPELETIHDVIEVLGDAPMTFGSARKELYYKLNRALPAPFPEPTPIYALRWDLPY